MKSKIFQKNISLGELVLALIVTLFFTLKCYDFYSQLRLANFTLTFTLASAAIFILICSLIRIFSSKASIIVMFILYFTASSLMAIDSVYYAYVSKLPSIAQLGMAGQIGGITDTVLNLIQFKHVILIADFPFWILYKAHKETIVLKINRIKSESERKTKKHIKNIIFSLASVALAAVLAVTVFLWPKFEGKYWENELLCYHINDIYSTIKNAYTEREPDKPMYEVETEQQSKYYGLASDRNVIIIQVEAMQNFVIGAYYEGQEIMPNLNSLIKNDSFYFDRYYYQIGGGNTSDAEFAVNNSLFAPEQEAAYMKYTYNKFFGLPHLLKYNGYTGAYAFHGYTGSFWNREEAYKAQGFDDFMSLEDFEQTDMFPMGLSDREMFRQSMEVIKNYEEPFYTFFITLSSHYPYAIPLKDRGIDLLDEDVGTLFGLYVQAMNYTDYAIGEFIDYLKEAGLYENSIIAIYGDHYALTNTDNAIAEKVKNMIGRTYTVFDVFSVPLIINVPGMGEATTISTAGGHIDVLPTLLTLLGINNDRAVMFGQNLLDAKEGFVCEQAHMARGSFISDDIFFKKPHNNIEANYDAYEYGTMERLDPNLFEEKSKEAERRILDCEALLMADDILLFDDDSEIVKTEAGTTEDIIDIITKDKTSESSTPPDSSLGANATDTSDANSLGASTSDDNFSEKNE